MHPDVVQSLKHHEPLPLRRPSNVALSVQLARLVIFGQKVLPQPVAQLLSMGPETPLDAGPVPRLVRFPQHPSVLCHLGLVLKIQNVRRWSLERHVLLQGIPESIYFISSHAAYIYAEHIVWDCIDWIAGKI